MKGNRQDSYYCFKVGPFTFECDNYEDWKPGLQLNLNSPLQEVLDPRKTFRSKEAVERYVRKQLLKMVKALAVELGGAKCR